MKKGKNILVIGCLLFSAGIFQGAEAQENLAQSVSEKWKGRDKTSLLF